MKDYHMNVKSYMTDRAKKAYESQHGPMRSYKKQASQAKSNMHKMPKKGSHYGR